MPTYIPRLTQNSPVAMLNNPDWYANNTFYNMPTNPPHDYGLPNCTCYCLGRWIELFRDYNLPGYPDTSLNNAYTWYGHNDSYERGQTPKLGAIACWKNTNSIPGEPLGSPGHVAIVEVLFPDGSYTTSNSNYGAEYFITYNVDSNNYFGDPNLEFQGFIYLPVDTPGGGGKIKPWMMSKTIKRRKEENVRKIMAPNGIYRRK